MAAAGSSSDINPQPSISNPQSPPVKPVGSEGSDRGGVAEQAASDPEERGSGDGAARIETGKEKMARRSEAAVEARNPRHLPAAASARQIRQPWVRRRIGAFLPTRPSLNVTARRPLYGGSPT